MNCAACQEKLHGFVDGELSAAEAREVEAHVATCADCGQSIAALREVRTLASSLPRRIAPARDLWPGIESEVERLDLKSLRFAKPSSEERGLGSSRATLSWLTPLAVAAAVSFLCVVAERRAEPPAWSVAAVAGVPRIDQQAVEREAPFRKGQWLETDAGSRAKVSVGSIGEVKVEANSRLQLTNVAATDHRIQLTHGAISAFIHAPPRLFFVDTAAATAVDLGCAYDLKVDENGNGELHVVAGYVALEDHGREAIIPTRTMCLTRRGIGPGTPFADNAPDALRAALVRFDFEQASISDVLPEILRVARADDSVTLWHLLARTNGVDREKVYDTLARLVPPPAGVTRPGVLAGNDGMRRRWGIELGLGTLAR